MTTYRISQPKRQLAALMTAVLLSVAGVAQADDRADVETARLMTLNLIQALVDNGVLTQDKADHLIADAKSKAEATVAARAAPAPIIATIGQPGPAEVGTDGKKVIHVAYIPEATKREMRDQIKAEVLAQSKSERWGNPGTLPDWLDRISMSGDIRVRNEYVKLNPVNSAPGAGLSDGVFTRAANLVGGALVGNLPTGDTQNNYDFSSLRARLNIDAAVSEMVSAGVSISTGNTNARNSMSQNLGQNFNYYSMVIDKAYVKLDMTPGLSFTGGRIANPFVSTDLLFADDVNFEGFALSTKFNVTPALQVFGTAGWFPLRMNMPGTTSGRNLGALQAGLNWNLTPKTNFKVAASMYDFVNIVGTAETDTMQVTAPDYVTRYEYPANFRQMGNTLFIINAPSTDPNINWGLASKFKEVDLVASLDIGHFDPFHIVLVSDYVKNIGFDRHDIFMRTGYNLIDGKNTGYQEKILIGMPVMKQHGDWNVSLAYRYLGSDAVLDAFVNPDFGLGSTNTKGTIFTVNYDIYKNTWLTARYLSSNLIDSIVPQHANTDIPTKLNTDVVQLEISARF